MNSSKLRIGVLLDDWFVPAWAATMLRQIADGDYAEICLVVSCVPASEEKNGSRSLWARVRQHRDDLAEIALRRSVAWLYNRLIDRARSLPSAEARVSVQELLQDIPYLRITPRRTQWSDYVADDDLLRITSFQLDVLIRLGFRILRGGILQAARHGVWSYHHGDNRVNRGGPPAFWESLEGWPETGCVLQVLSEDLDNGRVLYRSYSTTHPMSIRDNRSASYWKSLAFMPRRLRELHRLGPTEFYKRIEPLNPPLEIYSHRLYTAPTTAEYTKLVLRKVWEKTKLRYRNLRKFAQWQVHYDFRPGRSTSAWRYQRLTPPKDRFWADPHAVIVGDRHYVFIEEYLFATERGHISLFEFDSQGRPISPTPRRVMQRPYHLSYPFVFEFDGAWYMVPETAERGTIEIYRARRFPDEWEFVAPLVENIKAYDATLLRHDGRWWMFANVVENEGGSSSDELFLYFADNPLSRNWTPHPLNPIVSDCKASRPAGRIIEIDGELFRPSQNGSKHYGHGLNFAKIEVLTTTDYREQIVSTMTPSWSKDVVSTHCYSCAGNLHVIDAQILVPR